MSSFTSQTTPSPKTRTSTASTSEALRGVCIGLVPLLSLAIFVAVAILVTAILRQSFENAGFFVWQRAALIAFVASIGLALLIYVVSLVVVIRAAARWQKSGFTLRSVSTLWTLVITAFIVLLPVIITVLLPQSPAP